MYCPKCGNPDQSPETYCRQCGVYLPDLTKPVVVVTTPETHVTANITLGVMTVAVSLAIALILYFEVLQFGEARPVLYAMFGLLIAMAAWHVQTVWRSLLLRKHFREQEMRRERISNQKQPIDGPDANRSLNEGNFEQFQPASITDRTTRQLEPKKRRSS
jgi:hypothetical protein